MVSRAHARGGGRSVRDGPSLTIAEVADRLNCAVITVRRRIEARKLVAWKDGRVVRVQESDLQTYIQNQKGDPS